MEQKTEDSLSLITDYVLNAVGYNRYLEFLNSNYINSKVEDVLLASNCDDIFENYFLKLAERINQAYQVEKKAEGIQENLNIKDFVDKNYSDELSLSKMQNIFDQSNGMSILQDNVLEQATKKLAETKSNLSKSKLPSKIVHLPLKELALSVNDIDYFLEKYCDEEIENNFSVNKYIVSQIVRASIREVWDSCTQTFYLDHGIKTSMSDLLVPQDTCDYSQYQNLVEEVTENFLQSCGSKANTSDLSDSLENKVIIYVQDNYSSETILRGINSRFDPDSTILNIQSAIASEISENPKFRGVSFNFWLEQFTKIIDLNLLSQLYQNTSKQEAYINENILDWKKAEENENTFFKIDRSIVKKLMEDLLNDSFDKAWDSFLENEGLTYQESVGFLNPSVETFCQIVPNQVGVATDEFLEKDKPESADDLQDMLKAYVKESYTIEFFRQQIKYLFNEEETKEKILSKLQMNFDFAKKNEKSKLNVPKLNSLSISKLVILAKQDSIKLLIEEYSLEN